MCKKSIEDAKKRLVANLKKYGKGFPISLEELEKQMPSQEDPIVNKWWNKSTPGVKYIRLKDNYSDF